MFGLLRTNFVIVSGANASGQVLGEFNRKFTLFDRYVLDLSPDATRSLDRRVALALGVMLDTGERRAAAAGGAENLGPAGPRPPPRRPGDRR
jgi:hypothetical protein